MYVPVPTQHACCTICLQFANYRINVVGILGPSINDIKSCQGSYTNHVATNGLEGVPQKTITLNNSYLVKVTTLGGGGQNSEKNGYVVCVWPPGIFMTLCNFIAVSINSKTFGGNSDVALGSLWAQSALISLRLGSCFYSIN